MIFCSKQWLTFFCRSALYPNRNEIGNKCDSRRTAFPGTSVYTPLFAWGENALQGESTKRRSRERELISDPHQSYRISRGSTNTARTTDRPPVPQMYVNTRLDSPAGARPPEECGEQIGLSFGANLENEWNSSLRGHNSP